MNSGYLNSKAAQADEAAAQVSAEQAKVEQLEAQLARLARKLQVVSDALGQYVIRAADLEIQLREKALENQDLQTALEQERSK